jgi:hypothetical protein
MMEIKHTIQLSVWKVTTRASPIQGGCHKGSIRSEGDCKTHNLHTSNPHMAQHQSEEMQALGHWREVTACRSNANSQQTAPAPPEM